MQTIVAVFAALANVARSLNRFAGAIDAVTDHVEQRVPVVGPNSAAAEIAAKHTPAIAPPAVMEQLGKANGRARKSAAAHHE